MTATTSLSSRLTAPTQRHLGWHPPLDGIRGLGVILVIAFHFMGSTYFEGAPILVDMFFVLSGFLITTLLFEERSGHGAISLRNFYLRRVFRLFPAVYALLAVFLVGLVLFGGRHRGELFAEFITAALYVYNFLIAWTGVEGKMLVQLWTLSVEEQFYFIWPIALIAALKARRHIGLHALLGFLVALIVAFPILRMTLDDELGARTLSSTVFGIAIMRPDSILLGCLAAVAWRLEPLELSRRTDRLLRVAATIAVTMHCMCLVLGGFGPFVPFTSVFYNLTVLAMPLWVVDLVRRPESGLSKVLSRPTLLWFGKRSYGIYIWHMLIYFPIQAFFSDVFAGRAKLTVLATFPFAFAITIGVAALSWNYIETPALRAKSRFSRPQRS